MPRIFPTLATFATLTVASHAQTPNLALMKYACGPANRMFASLSPTSRFTDTTAGFDLIASPEIAGNSCTSDQPFFFSVAIPEGNYRVTVILGGPQASVTTVRAEGRRLMLEKIPTEPNASLTRSFDTNVRYPEIAGNPANLVKLKDREQGILNWDHKLTLEFNGDHPSVRSISIEPIPNEPTIYLAGDSTVVDQYYEPWAAWGQMLPRFFLPGVVIANHAESGETTRSFVTEHRLAKIMTTIKPGDYLFIQFAHNDMKPGAVSLDDYKTLLADYIAQSRAKGATPVLVTSMNRRTFDDSGHITNSFGGYPDAMREVAAQQKVALIDLNAMSKTLFETLGPEGSIKAFMHYPANAYVNQTKAISDDTHFNSYGAYELARCIVHSIRESNLPIAKFLDPAVPDFNPAHPDSQPDFHLPATPILIKSDPTKVGQT
ncbi:rhamnogalacturonan acetylesterase [Tunturiibacter lichenicola]|uniref:rhamnogalacturonan acetylesterase n=1 Tax=Tunturiibacter lichenicola TaxID=2051959 RepID=UPI0021B2BF84|nr:rhamnogalacturonan acetylesterase [Edaphobacter lichenicola]